MAHPKVEKLPVVGVAIRLTKLPDSVVGGLFCFLPIGDIKTGLPVHLNADFKLTPDRRKLVETLEGEAASGELEQGRWNRQLTAEVLPRLWAEALSNVIPHLDGDTWDTAGCSEEEAMYAALPDLCALSGDEHNEWRVCYKRLYTLLGDKRIIRHRYAEEGMPKWVSPSASLAFTSPTKALAAQRDHIMEMYTKCPQLKVMQEVSRLSVASRDLHIVAVSEGLQKAFVSLSGMQERSIDEVLFCILTAAKNSKRWPEAPELYDVLMPLLEHAGQTFKESQNKKVRTQWPHTCYSSIHV